VGVRIDVAARAFAGSGAEVEHPRRIDGGARATSSCRRYRAAALAASTAGIAQVNRAIAPTRSSLRQLARGEGRAFVNPRRS
jgi:hypothetical protein